MSEKKEVKTRKNVGKGLALGRGQQVLAFLLISCVVLVGFAQLRRAYHDDLSYSAAAADNTSGSRRMAMDALSPSDLRGLAITVTPAAATTASVGKPSSAAAATSATVKSSSTTRKTSSTTTTVKTSSTTKKTTTTTKKTSSTTKKTTTTTKKTSSTAKKTTTTTKKASSTAKKTSSTAKVTSTTTKKTSSAAEKASTTAAKDTTAGVSDNASTTGSGSESGDSTTQSPESTTSTKKTTTTVRKTTTTTKRPSDIPPNQYNESKYYIVVYKGSQSTVVYGKDDNGNYTKRVKVFTCSTGKSSSPTRTGTYRIRAKYRWRLLSGNVYGQYNSSISRSYLFHSVPYYHQDASTLENEEYDKLGSPASKGCIRMCVRDTKWIYDNCPIGTEVNIVNQSGPAGPGVPGRKRDSAYAGWDPSDKWARGNPYFAERS